MWSAVTACVFFGRTPQALLHSSDTPAKNASNAHLVSITLCSEGIDADETRINTSKYGVLQQAVHLLVGGFFPLLTACDDSVTSLKNVCRSSCSLPIRTVLDTGGSSSHSDTQQALPSRVLARHPTGVQFWLPVHVPATFPSCALLCVACYWTTIDQPLDT